MTLLKLKRSFTLLPLCSVEPQRARPGGRGGWGGAAELLHQHVCSNAIARPGRARETPAALPQPTQRYPERGGCWLGQRVETRPFRVERGTSELQRSDLWRGRKQRAQQDFQEMMSVVSLTCCFLALIHVFTISARTQSCSLPQGRFHPHPPPTQHACVCVLGGACEGRIDLLQARHALFSSFWRWEWSG